jgi:hypothetical protein
MIILLITSKEVEMQWIFIEAWKFTLHITEVTQYL